jgi:hypothetical protein
MVSDGQILSVALHIIVVGSQHLVLLPNLGVIDGVNVAVGQRIEVDVHCMRVGSQQSVMGAVPAF